MGPTYRIGEVAARTGVTVRTLHHYDRIGLLRPSGRTEAGHRRYAPADLLRLQQILTLRYLGFPLSRIADLLARPDFDVIASLRAQQAALRDRIAELTGIGAIVADLVARRLATGAWDWDVAIAASAAVRGGPTRGGDDMDAYYTPDQLARFAQLDQQISPQDRAAIEAAWPPLLAEVRAAVAGGLDPADPAARTLAARWHALVAATFREDTDLRDTVGARYAEGAFADRADVPTPDDFAFIARVDRASTAGDTTPM